MKLRILASAKTDLEEGYWFYEAQNESLGEYFVTSVAADIESLRLYGGIHSVVYKQFHRFLCHTFPFAVYYLKSDDVVTVYAIVDCRRDPAWIRQHLKESGQQPPATPAA